MIRLVPLVLLFATVASAQSSIDVVRTQIRDYYTIPSADRSDPRVAESVWALEAYARDLMGPEWMREDGSWTDINYQEIPSGNWSPWEHFRRILHLAKAYKTPGQALYGDPALKAKLEASIAYVSTFYGATVNTGVGNWWFWTIGPSLEFGPALVLVSDDISAEVRIGATNILSARIGPYVGWRSGSNSLLTGQNLVWSSINHLMLAVLQGDMSRAAQVRDRMNSVTGFVNPGSDGMQRDLSFHQHGPQLYTGGYGGSFAFDVSRYVLFTRNTDIGLSRDRADAFSEFVAEGIRWSLYGPYFDVSVIGREVCKPWTSGWNGFAALLQMTEVPSSRQKDIRGAAAKMLEYWTWTLLPEMAGLAYDVNHEPAASPLGNRYYVNSDYAVHRRPSWFASVKMFSNRTKSGERTNQENLLGARQSDGRLYLTLGTNDFTEGNVWPTMDWTRLPGITVEQKADTATGAYGYSSKSFVGGVSNGENGTAAMDLAPVGSGLTAKKGWVFFDDSIVFFANSIRSTSANRIETVIDQRPMRDTQPLVVDGATYTGGTQERDLRWAAGDRVGYWFPKTTRVTIREEARTGSWAELGNAAGPEPYTNDIRTLWIDHGANITGRTAEYVVVPNVTANAMSAWAAAEPIEILMNNATASAARDRRNGDLGVIFWQAGTAGGYSADRPAVLYRSQAGRIVTLSVTDPTQATRTIRITVPGVYSFLDADRAVSVSQTATSTVVDVPVISGKTSTVRLSEPEAPTGRRRAIR